MLICTWRNFTRSKFNSPQKWFFLLNIFKITQGLASGLTRFFEELKYIITLYQNIKADATYPFPEVDNYVEVYSGNE